MSQVVDQGGLCFVPSIEQNKELRFLYALSKSSGSRILEGTSISIGTSPKDIMTDIEITTTGEDTSTYNVDFNDEIVDSVFLDYMQKYGFRLDFISVSKYLKKGEVTVWFKEVL